MKRIIVLIFQILFFSWLTVVNSQEMDIKRLIAEFCDGILKRGKLYEKGFKARVELVKIGQPAVPYLIDVLNETHNSKDEEKLFLHTLTLRSLIQIGKKSVPGLLERLANEENFSMRSKIYFILSRIKDTESIPYLLRTLDDCRRSLIERQEVCITIGEIGGELGTDGLLNSRSFQDSNMRSSVLHGLAKAETITHCLHSAS